MSKTFNGILNIRDSYEAPARVLELLTSSPTAERDSVFYALAKVNGFDFSADWFWAYFQEEHADRKTNKQDFTPSSISRVVHSILRHDTHSGVTVTYEPAAGTGQMVICDWFRHRERQMPWDYRPSEHIYVCAEYSIKTVPFLLFNLAVRGVVALVYHMNTLTGAIDTIYKVENPRDSTLSYSDVSEVAKESDDYMFLSQLISKKNRL